MNIYDVDDELRELDNPIEDCYSFVYFPDFTSQIVPTSDWWKKRLSKFDIFDGPIKIRKTDEVYRKGQVGYIIDVWEVEE